LRLPHANQQISQDLQGFKDASITSLHFFFVFKQILRLYNLKLKKFITIILLAVQLFNIAGPLLLYQYLVYQSEKLFEEQISKNNYEPDDLFEVKIPVKMSTVQDWTDYAYISGRVEFKSTDYNYVKLKMTRDTIYLMCVPNYKTTKLSTNNIIDAKGVPEIPVNKKEHVPFGKTSTPGLFGYCTPQYGFFVPALIVSANPHDSLSSIVNPAIAFPGEPPETQDTISI
jgi:hypothetical protein